MGEQSAAISADRLNRLLPRLWERTKGKGWEPPDPQHPLIIAAIDAGYLRRVDGICGFERFKDACVVWTEAGRAALASQTQETDRG